MIGVCAERSIELIEGILGALRAGAAYLPLDPGHPEDRLQLFLDDARSPILLTPPELAHRLPAFRGRRAILGADLPPAAPPPLRSAGSDLAYVMYTSGSTGRPKGVAVPQRAVARLVLATDYVALGAGDHLAQTSPMSFDASTFELWGALLHGGRLVGAPPDLTLSPAAFAEFLAGRQITSLFLTTALFNQMAREAPWGFSGLRDLLFGGEAVDPEAVRSLLRGRPPRRLLHVYGPTESTTFATWYEVPASEDAAPAASTVPIGRPVANTRVYLLAVDGAPAPPGGIGEICIGGDGLACGYLGDPALTALKLVPDPFGEAPGGRLYRSGDLARLDVDEAIEFIGRVDHQVKLRGFRIELGEIESVLRDHPEVSTAAVVVREDAPGARKLVAYVAGAGGEPPSVGALRDHLALHLPAYMVPATFVFLARLPLNPHGKVDRRRLPAPASRQRTVQEAYVAPRTPVEQVLANVFAEVLGVDSVGVYDDFFALGGHSLLATQLVSRLGEAFHIELPIRELFENPTLVELAASVEAAAAAASGLRPQPIERVDRGRRLPLSFSQQRLWFIDRLEPNSPKYNMFAGFRLAGPLAAAALAAAFAEISRRHEVLRTVFAAHDGVPEQIVLAAAPMLREQVDLRGLPPAAREAELRRLAEGHARRPFDLARQPPLRLALLRTAAAEHVLFLAMHHIACDAWSIGVLLRELEAIYGALVARQPPPLPELPVQYADFAAWQRQRMAGRALAAEIEFWRDKLRGLPPLLALPLDHPRRPVPGAAGRALTAALPPALLPPFYALCQRSGVTPFMGLLAVFETLLHRHGGDEAFAVGTPVAGRNRLETEGLIGFFVNILVLRADLSRRPDFAALLARVRHDALESYLHQDLPFEKLVEELQPDRSLQGSPLYQVMFTLESIGGQGFRLATLTPQPLAGFSPSQALVDLSLTVRGERDALAVEMVCRRELFDATTVRRMLDHFAAVLALVVADPEMDLALLGLLNDAERGQLLREWSDTAAPLVPAGLHELFEAQARRTPTAAALAAGGGEISYAELDARADRLALRLRQLGVGAEAPVGLFLPRSAASVVAQLAVLKAGGCFVPLDPELPPERLAAMVEDARPLASIALAETLAALPAGAGLSLEVTAGGEPVEPVESTLSAVERPAAAAPPQRSAPESLAYILFTSGSTGRPKGVMVSHRAIVNQMAWMLAAYPLAAGDRMLAKTAPTFDAAVWETFAPLLAGACLVVAEPGEERDAGRLVARLAADRITLLQVVPTVLELLLERPALAACTHLRRVYSGGEALRPQLRDLCLARLAVELVDLYGPTEATINATSRRWRAGDRGAASIGRPVRNLRAVVADAAQRPVPMGVEGELLLGGAGLARGYAGRGDLTAERFVPDDLHGEPGGRLYRTGDRVRHSPAGELEFRGRVDGQVKIRGFRIELGEIESLLARHPAVLDAAVVARDDQPGGRALVAYVVAAERQAAGASALREHLARLLPAYMLPAAFVFLGALPLNAHGKVDRRKLPAPTLQESYVAPRTPVEQVLANLFAEVLGVESVGIHDDFFALGGHSLLATQVISRLGSAFHVELPMRELFERPTVLGLAAAVEAAVASPAGQPNVPIEPRDRRQGGLRLPLSFSQQRLWFIDRLVPNSPTYNMFTGFRIAGPLDAGMLAAALGEIARRHEVLRTVFVAEEGAPEQVVLPAERAVCQRIDLAGLAAAAREGELRRIADAHALRPFDLAHDVPLRPALLRTAAGEHVLLITLHHIAGDGWSMGILMQEVQEIYGAFLARRPSPLPELAVQYADFAAWQRQRMDGTLLAAEIEFWRQHLRDLPPLLALPLDHPRSDHPSSAGRAEAHAVPAPLLGPLFALCQRSGVTPFMGLLALFEALLHRLCGQEDFAVGTPLAGRNRLEIEGLIGFFVNLVVLRADLAERPDLETLLARVRRDALEAYLHQDLPFEKLVEELQPDRSLQSSPLYQAMFTYESAGAADLRLGDLALRPLFGYTPVRALVDLSLTVRGGRDGLAMELICRRELFDAATVRRVLQQLAALLALAVAEPSRPLDELAPLSDGERAQLLREWSDTEAPAPEARGLHELFEAQVRRSPAAAALAAGGREISYAELDARAERLARRLRRLGVGPEVVVGLSLPRSAAAVVAELAVLKAAGCFLPLDPELPGERLAAMLEDARPRVLIALASEPPAALAVAAALAVLSISAAGELANEAPAAPPPAEVRSRRGVAPDSLAYVLFTSGSSGRPKGVMISHRAIVRQMVWMLAAYPLAAGDRMLLKTATTFDAVVWETFAPLLAGACLVVAPPGEERAPAALAARLEADRITLVQVVPTVLELLLAEPALAACSRLRRIYSGGEALRPPLIRLCHARLAVELVNLYGPTEVTINATSRRSRASDVSRADAADAAGALIGRPVDGCRAVVVDVAWQPAPIGVEGELLLGGAGLARGYVGRPELTAERFVPDPFHGEPGGRLYRTGDRVRHTTAGELEFLGRIDAQVKIRGHRVELGEIEALLSRHPAVREAAVVARGDQPGGIALVAFVVAVEAVDGEELRAFLGRHLPPVMVPHRFVALDAMPLTRHGKADRGSLLARDLGALPRAAGAAPRDVLELTIVRVWEELLELPPGSIGVRDAFFSLGGHSLLAVRLVAVLGRRLGRRIPLHLLFQNPTVRTARRRAPPSRRAAAGVLPRRHADAGRPGADVLGPPDGRQRLLLPRARSPPGAGAALLRLPIPRPRRPPPAPRHRRGDGGRLPRGAGRRAAARSVSPRRLVDGRHHRLRDGLPAGAAGREGRSHPPRQLRRGRGLAGDRRGAPHQLRRRPRPVARRAAGGGVDGRRRRRAAVPPARRGRARPAAARRRGREPAGAGGEEHAGEPPLSARRLPRRHHPAPRLDPRAPPRRRSDGGVGAPGGRRRRRPAGAGRPLHPAARAQRRRARPSAPGAGAGARRLRLAASRAPSMSRHTTTARSHPIPGGSGSWRRPR